MSVVDVMDGLVKLLTLSKRKADMMKPPDVRSLRRHFVPNITIGAQCAGSVKHLLIEGTCRRAGSEKRSAIRDRSMDGLPYDGVGPRKGAKPLLQVAAGLN